MGNYIRRLDLFPLARDSPDVADFRNGKNLYEKPLEIAVAVRANLGWTAFPSHACWGLIAWWPFVVFSLCFMAWQKKSVGRAITVTALVYVPQHITSYSYLAGHFSTRYSFFLESKKHTSRTLGTNRRTAEQEKIKPRLKGFPRPRSTARIEGSH